MLSKLRTSKTKKVSFITGFAVALASLFGVAVLNVGTVAAAACPPTNDIMYGGFSSKQDFINKVQSGSDGHGHSDLKAIYSNYKLVPAQYAKFASSAVAGYAKKNGDIVVSGTNQVVGHNGFSIGRTESCQGSGAQKVPIPGAGTMYGNTNDKNFVSDNIPVMILFDDNGIAIFAVMNQCGNPSRFTSEVPTHSCDALAKTPVAGQKDTYQFTTSAQAAHGAAITSVTYDFGDGVTKTVTNLTPVDHTYTKPGTYTATVKVTASLPGNQSVTFTDLVKCKTVVTIPPPAPECVQLDGPFIDKDEMSVQYTAKAKFADGITFVSADFDFGDGSNQTGVKPSGDGTTATTTHTYTKADTYNANAVLHFSIDGKPVTAEACTAMVTPTKPPTPTCKPNVPVGSPECLPPCTVGSSVPPESEQCQPPVLPKTGAGNTIAIFAATVIGGFLVYRQLLFRQHKAAFTAAEQGTSPLPLADPLSDAPLDGTPLATSAKKRLSFRRKRHF